MKSVRIKFSKLSTAKYISHLDLSRCMQRAIKRAALPVWYTEGFNPHMYVNFLSPLSLGTESLCEFMDIRLLEDIEPEEIISRLSSQLQGGLNIISCAPPKHKNTEIESAQYEITVKCNDTKELAKFISADKLEVKKQRKKHGEYVIDIKPAIIIDKLNFDENKLFIDINLPSGVHESINPSLIFEAFEASYADKNVTIDSMQILRTNLFCANGKEFR